MTESDFLFLRKRDVIVDPKGVSHIVWKRAKISRTADGLYRLAELRERGPYEGKDYDVSILLIDEADWPLWKKG
jgi:hypothetical protein